MSKRKSENLLIRFVWSRKIDYDYLLLLETEARNPFSFKKPKPVWEEIAKVLREGECKMKVTERSCRERVVDLLKKHRKREGEIMRSTGATDDMITELQKLLTSINQMSLTKPNDTDSTLYKKKNKKEGEAIRDAALNEISDTDSDDYINIKSNKKSRDDGEMNLVTDARDLFNNDDTTLEQQHLMDQELIAQAEPSTSIDEDQLSSDQSNVWKNTPSSSSDNRFSIPVEKLQSINVDAVSAEVDTDEDDGESLVNVINEPTLPTPQPVFTIKKFSGQPDAHISSSRFSNPKKDLINYLERKSLTDIGFRGEEIRIRHMEAINKRDELKILRLKTESEAEERKRSLEVEAENKKEELRILRLKTEAEIDERKKTQDLLISLLTKNNSNQNMI